MIPMQQRSLTICVEQLESSLSCIVCMSCNAECGVNTRILCLHPSNIDFVVTGQSIQTKAVTAACLVPCGSLPMGEGVSRNATARHPRPTIYRESYCTQNTTKPVSVRQHSRAQHAQQLLLLLPA